MVGEFVIDASVVMAWCFEDESNTYTDTVLDSLETRSAVVPAIWPLEICNVLLAAERKTRIGEADSIRFMTLIANLPIVIEQESPERMVKEIFALARAHNLSSYDASCLDLAMRKGLPIATLDKKLMGAAQRGNVPVFKKRVIFSRYQADSKSSPGPFLSFCDMNAPIISAIPIALYNATG